MKNNWDISDLPWLPEPPKEFRKICQALRRESGVWSDKVSCLSGYRLSTDQLITLSSTIRDLCMSNPTGGALLSDFRLGILSNSTMNIITSAIVGSAPRAGLLVDALEASYDQVMQEALNPQSALNTAPLDAVLLAIDFRALPFEFGIYGDASRQEASVERAMDFVRTVRDGLVRGRATPIIFQTLSLPPEPVFGSLDGRIPGTNRSMFRDFNTKLREWVAKGPDYLFDVEALADAVGTINWHDPVQWNLYKLPFSQRMVPFYAERVVSLLGAIRGKSRKCLVLDLDNTLWGGVVGDDGLNGILLGQGSGVGEAFLDIQRMALALRSRGVVLAICSKNTEEVAREPFRNHPEMLLKEGHIAVFVANWEDKASNIEYIARSLSIGVDAIVFLDDNPFEREQVRRALPSVAIPELPDDPSYFARTLLWAGYFEAIHFTQEDLLRANQYQQSIHSEVLKNSTRDLGEYLRSLNMEINFKPFDKLGRSRITQLINKTNQFNLTTRRYNESEVEQIENSASCITLQVRLKDSLGDHGMISVVVCKVVDTHWEIDTWLMSCRVLGRLVENAVLNEVVDLALHAGITELRGRYIPTQKNDMVSSMYPSLGFELSHKAEDGATEWRLNCTKFKRNIVPMVRV
jgi:FkbH-like protein